VTFRTAEVVNWGDLRDTVVVALAGLLVTLGGIALGLIFIGKK
jgi:hypothetical protein